jgi:hypothetical protein
LSTTASPPVHASSSDSASETCRFVLLPSAQTPLMICLLQPLHQSTPALQTALQKHAGLFFCPELRHPLNDLSTTASPPVHANSSDEASETCRCVLLPSAQPPLNDLSSTASLPVHANSSGSALETCRCVLLPSAQTSLNDLQTSQPVHTNSSHSASKTCRSIFCPDDRSLF